MTPEERLCFHVVSGGVDLSFTCNYSIISLQKSTDCVTWESWEANTPVSIPEGGKLYLFNPNETCCIQFQTVETVANSILDCSGNIMSLIADGEGTLGGIAFKRMFMDTIIRTAPELPATSLSNAPQCYEMMFEGCSRLEQAPELPATTLSHTCYRLMFAHCPNLNTPPSVLPAAILKDNCYEGMFLDTGITFAPEISATTVASESCKSMFTSCANLQTAQATLAPTTLASECYYNMFSGCSSLENAPTLPATTLGYRCYEGMFSGCSSLQEAPELPATTLAQECYHAMFDGCSSLTTSPDLPATTLERMCYAYMFRGCTSIVDPIYIGATTLAPYCCMSMFEDCTSLQAPPMLLSTTGVEGAYATMFRGCTGIAGGATETDENKYLYRIPYGGEYDGSWDTLYSTFEDTPLSGLLYSPENVVYTKYPSHPSEGWFWLQNEKESGDCQVTFKFYSNLGVPTESHVQYSTNLVDWNDVVNDGQITVSFSDRVYLRNLVNTLSTDKTSFRITSNGLSTENIFSAHGDLKALINNGELTPYCFEQLFYESHIIAAYTDFNLPLTEACFFQMFEYCDQLEYVPDLTADVVPQDAYGFMFSKSHKLTIPPAITATQIGNGGCRGMFKGCTSLTKTPALPAMILDSECYKEMFSGCTSLTMPCKLPATTLQAANYESMFENCTGITLKEEKTSDYSVPYRIPTSGSATTQPMSLYPTTNMFRITTNEDSVVTPELEKTYYLYGRCNGVYHWDGTKWILDANVGDGGGSTDVEVDGETIVVNADNKISVNDEGLNAKKIANNAIGKGIKKSTDETQIESFVPYGTTFPSTPAPQLDDQFILTENTSTQQAGLYRFDGTEWKSLNSSIKCGDALPDDGNEDELFVLIADTTDNVSGLYRFNSTKWELVADKPYEIISNGVDPENPVSDVTYHIFEELYDMSVESKLTTVDRPQALTPTTSTYYIKKTGSSGVLPLIFNSELNVWNFNPAIFGYSDIPMSDIPPCWINEVVIQELMSQWGVMILCDEDVADYKTFMDGDYWQSVSMLYPIEMTAIQPYAETYMRIVDEMRPYIEVTVSEDGSLDGMICTLDNTKLLLNPTSTDDVKESLKFMTTDRFGTISPTNLRKVEVCSKEKADFVVRNNKFTIVDGVSTYSYVSGEFGAPYLNYKDSKILFEDELRSVYPTVRYAQGINMTEDKELTSTLKALDGLPLDLSEFIVDNYVYVNTPVYDIYINKSIGDGTKLIVDKPFICDGELYKSAYISVAYTIDQVRCIGCNLCARDCPTNAISGTKAHGETYVIDQTKCTQCGKCFIKCKKSAIVTSRLAYYTKLNNEKVYVLDNNGWIDDKYRRIKIAQNINNECKQFIYKEAIIENCNDGGVFRLNENNCWEQVVDKNNMICLPQYEFSDYYCQNHLKPQSITNLVNVDIPCKDSTHKADPYINVPCISVSNTLRESPVIELNTNPNNNFSGYKYTFEFRDFRYDEVAGEYLLDRLICGLDRKIPTISVRHPEDSDAYEFQLHFYNHTSLIGNNYSIPPFKTGDVLQIEVQENSFAQIKNCSTNTILARWDSSTEADKLIFVDTGIFIGTARPGYEDMECQIGILRFDYSLKHGVSGSLTPMVNCSVPTEEFMPYLGHKKRGTGSSLSNISLNKNAWIANGSAMPNDMGGIAITDDYTDKHPIVVSKPLYKHRIVFDMMTSYGLFYLQCTITNHKSNMSKFDFYNYLVYNHRSLYNMWNEYGIDYHYMLSEPQMPLEIDCVWGTSGVTEAGKNAKPVGVFVDALYSDIVVVYSKDYVYNLEMMNFGAIEKFRDFPEQIS